MTTALDIEIPDLLCRLVDVRNVSVLDRGAAVDRMNEALVVEVLEQSRPGVDLCCGGNAGSENLGFVVYHEGEVKGIFTLYGLVRGDYSMTASPLPGFRTWAPHEKHVLWGKLMSFFLHHAIEFSDDDAWGLTGWTFPEDQGHEWDSRASEKLPDLLDELLSDDFAIYDEAKMATLAQQKQEREQSNPA